jgi:methylmalonyl-CoA mutase N-terminal domain/subunit
MIISGFHIREAGATAVQSSRSVRKCDRLCPRRSESRLAIDSLVPAFRSSSIRTMTLRRLREVVPPENLATIAKNRFGAKNPRTWMLRFHARPQTLDRQQPDNNVVRWQFRRWLRYSGSAVDSHDLKDEALACRRQKRRVLLCERSRSSP